MSKKSPKSLKTPKEKMKQLVGSISFDEQIHLDQQRYSRYVCDSRAIPNIIDGLKPVQRRILWTMWNSSAKNRFTKTVKVAGMTMAYHPHGNVSIEDAISSMTQSFTFSNNYPLVEGEGTFGDILDPKAIASARYTEVRLSQFAHDVGLFELLHDIEYVPNYDETEKEPIFFVPKVPLVLLNPCMGIATGFRCDIPARSLDDVVSAMLDSLDGTDVLDISPWYRGFLGWSAVEYNEEGSRFFVTGFGFKKEKEKMFLTDVPQGWNREKTIAYLENVVKAEENDLSDYVDYSMDCFRIELVFLKKKTPKKNELAKIFSKKNRENIEQYVINDKGRLARQTDGNIISIFLECRKKYLKKRFVRLAQLESQIIAKEKELIRFIAEKWYEKLVKIKSKSFLEQALQKEKFVFFQWLASLPIYRLTEDEVKKSKESIKNALKNLERYQKLYKEEATLKSFIKAECLALLKKFGRDVWPSGEKK